MIRHRSTLLFSLLLLLHILHSYAERNEEASFIVEWYQNYSTYYYLEIIAIIGVIIIFILHLLRVKWSYHMIIIYSTVMVINGLYHIYTIAIEGKNFSDNIGSIITSLGFVLLSIILVWSLMKGNKAVKNIFVGLKRKGP